MPACELNGIKLHWMERGAGPPMLLLGGTLSLGPEDFAPQIEHFSKTFRVILPDRRGYGRSRPPDRDYPPDFYQRDADDIAALLQKLRAEEKGTLLASGLIAGEAIVGILQAVLFLAGISSITRLLTGRDELSFFPAWGGWLSLLGFAAVAYVLVRIPTRRQA